MDRIRKEFSLSSMGDAMNFQAYYYMLNGKFQEYQHEVVIKTQDRNAITKYIQQSGFELFYERRGDDMRREGAGSKDDDSAAVSFRIYAEDSDHEVFYKRGNILLRLADLDYSNFVIMFLGGLYDKNEIITMVDALKGLHIAEKKKNIFMVTYRHNEITLSESKIQDTGEIDLALHYGESFLPVDKVIREDLQNKNSGVVLLHGKPGTGKTYYLRNLINSIDRKFIYIPSFTVSSLGSPSMVSLLERNKGSVFVVEDAEQCIMDRGNGDNGGLVSILLNYSDGILSDFFKSKLICTFNCDIGKIDEAFLRKGRLVAKHEFGKLDKDGSQKLIDKLGIKTKVDSGMTLAEIYNFKKENFVKEEKEKKIGFLS